MKENNSNNQRKSQSHDPETEVLVETIFETKEVLRFRKKFKRLDLPGLVLD